MVKKENILIIAFYKKGVFMPPALNYFRQAAV